MRDEFTEYYNIQITEPKEIDDVLYNALKTVSLSNQYTDPNKYNVICRDILLISNDASDIRYYGSLLINEEYRIVHLLKSHASIRPLIDTKILWNLILNILNTQHPMLKTSSPTYEKPEELFINDISGEEDYFIISLPIIYSSDILSLIQARPLGILKLNNIDESINMTLNDSILLLVKLHPNDKVSLSSNNKELSNIVSDALRSRIDELSNELNLSELILKSNDNDIQYAIMNLINIIKIIEDDYKENYFPSSK